MDLQTWIDLQKAEGKGTKENPIRFAEFDGSVNLENWQSIPSWGLHGGDEINGVIATGRHYSNGLSKEDAIKKAFTVNRDYGWTIHILDDSNTLYAKVSRHNQISICVIEP